MAGNIPESEDPIKLAINEWTGQHITTHIAGKILRKMGYVEHFSLDTRYHFHYKPIHKKRLLINLPHTDETFEKCSILFKFKAGENFNHPSTICRTYGASRNTLSILRIALKLHFVQNVEPNAEIGQKGAFCNSLRLISPMNIHVNLVNALIKM